MKAADPTWNKTQKTQVRLYEGPRVRVVRPKLDESITTTINSSSPQTKRIERKV
jgi:hypothetical protein